MIFYLGTDDPGWLARADVPLFVSHGRLRKRVKLPVAVGPWALDSGAFSEIFRHGCYREGPDVYAEAATRYGDSVGLMKWAAIQDWMCEPFILEKTGKTIREHQSLTIQSYFDLNRLAPTVPWVPVLQGWEIDDYLDHARQYEDAGIDLGKPPVVGVGSVCRRQGTDEITELFAELGNLGLRLHGFGVKTEGLRRASIYLESSDSMAWSRQARWRPPLPGCTHRNCSHCLKYAMRWRENVLAAIDQRCQSLFIWGNR